MSTTSTPFATSSITAAVNAIVNHDAATSGATAMNATVAHIEQLANECQVWQDNAFRTSNEQKYVLLQKCYQFYKAIELGDEAGKALKSGLNDYINLKGLRFAKSTHTLAKIVKCVFGADRRRVSAYSIVLRAALEQGKTVFDIPAFIRDAGGVEEIRLSKAPNAMTAKQRAVAATKTVVNQNLGAISHVTLGQKLDAGKVGTEVVLIGTWQADGSVIVRAVVESDTALNAALASYYSANKAATPAKVAETTAANDANEQQRAIAQAAAA